jgi:hypothetical protein
MNVVSDTADALWESFESLDGATQVLMEAILPRWFNQGSAIFGVENEVVMKAEVRGRHDVCLWHPFQGASYRWDRLPVVSLALYHRLIACKPPAC